MSTDVSKSAPTSDAALNDQHDIVEGVEYPVDEHVIDGGNEGRKRRKTGDMEDTTDLSGRAQVEEEHKPQGRLVPLKTTLKTRMKETLVDVYVTKVPVKKASACLDIIRKLIPNDGGLDMQHLRRFAKDKDVPKSVKEVFGDLVLASANNVGTDGAHSTENVKRITPPPAGELYLIIGSTNIVTKDAIFAALSNEGTNPAITVLPVPLLAPTTAEQAKLWSTAYWPTVYKKSNPFGPHLSLVTRTADEISADTSQWMELAESAAQEAKNAEFGEAVGVVVVERRNGVARPIAVAGDARWKHWSVRDGSGNVTAHAAMRAIGMVAEGLKERDFRNGLTISSPAPVVPEIFQDLPVSDVERDNYDPTSNESGYLCFDLEIYCTHEPCVMCSMAIIHSRFGKLVFGKRMMKTGAIVADDDGLGCGLWWRKELNWTMLAWQYVREEDHDQSTSEEGLHA